MKFETQTSKHYSGMLLEIWSKILFNQNFLLISDYIQSSRGHAEAKSDQGFGFKDCSTILDVRLRIDVTFLMLHKLLS